MKGIKVPVMMYHSVGMPNKKWRYNHLTCPYELFEDQLRWLKKKRFHIVSLMDLYKYMKKGTELPKNPIVLTFDDGYLDNWVFAYPLLKKYGFNGTIYVNPEFADPRNVTRKNLENVWRGDAEINELKTIGYLSWEEMKEMEKEGVIDIQSHAMTHTGYFISDKIIDFRHPGDSYLRITWNNNPDKKPFLQLENEKLINYGEPVYENDYSLASRRYFPDEYLQNHLINYVTKNGGKSFFDKNDWKNKLYEVVRKYKENHKVSGRFESDEEYEKRIRYELEQSKKIIQEKLSKKIEFLGWPNGALSKKALKIANEVGYLSSTTAKDIPNKQRALLKNQFGDDPTRIRRISPALYWNYIANFNNKIKYKNGFLFVMSLYHFQGRKIIAPTSLLILGLIAKLYKSKYEIFQI